MGSFSIWHWLIVAFIVLLLFGGKNKLSNLMGDMGKGLRSFKDNFKPEDQKNESTVHAQPASNNAGAQVVNIVPEASTDIKKEHKA